MIIEIIIWIAAFCACFALQTTVMPFLAIAGIEPDLIVVALLILSFRYGSMTGIWAGFFMGLCQDIYSPTILGQNALAKAFIGFFIGLFNERVMSTGPFIKIIILAVTFIIHDSLFMAVEVFRHGTTIPTLLLSLVTISLPRILYSSVFAGAYYLWGYYNARPRSLKR